MKESNQKTKEKEKVPYKTAFYVSMALFFCSLIFFLSMRWISIRSASKIESYEAIFNVPTTSSEQKSTPGIINVNTASADELTKLPGIGETKAAAIVEYIKENGYLHNLDELKQIRGIGDGIAEQLEPYVIFDIPEETEVSQ